MTLYTKPKQRVAPRLERRNAIKNIEYDASPSSSSFDNQSAHRTRSLDIASLSDRTSFRIDGIDGEIDLIYRSLGLKGPEDFAIAAADWEAHKSYCSVAGGFSSSSRRRYSHEVSTGESPESDLSVSFGRIIGFRDDEVTTDGECAETGEARVLVANGANKRDDDVADGGINDNRFGNDYSEISNGVGLASGRRARVLKDGGNGDTDNKRGRRHPEGEGGIKGLRPPLLAPPPVMSRAIVDDVGSNWDLIRSFAPTDNEDLVADGPAEAITSLNEGSNVVTNDVEDDVFSSAAAEPRYSLSPNGLFRGSFKNWQKGDILGSGSFGTVYEGFNE